MYELSVNSGVDGTRDMINEPPYQVELEMMRAIADADNAAMEKLVSQHGKSLAILIGRLMAWHHDCDDILQDVFLIVWQQADRYRGIGPLEGWLKRIAINRCQNHFRTVNLWKRKLKQLTERLIFSPTQTQPTVYSTANQVIANESLDYAMSQLDPDDRMGIVLFYLEGYSGKEVAAQLGIEVDAFHVRIHRTKKRLKKMMEAT